MSVPARYGITVPFNDVPLHEHRSWYEEVAALGYTDVWSAEDRKTIAAAWDEFARECRAGA